ncbi:pyrroline-5-carboxylate reductase [Azospira restricta]|uniref:Pyrroline-5-carboxylate reductase n=1 Tax=Azospira restricta TaxID=404405 RepID=A0A974SPV9_9RHOO|nr:pyrroline-5-carboxylate reductase [Azospira restricta]QRJ64229.1 pyrroline-5-carboxylate reductase [Azospira restricta]
MKITFLGGGNMANALIGGLVGKGFAAADIAAVEREPDNRAKLEAAYGIRTYAGPDAEAWNCDLIVLAVKPQQMKEACAPLLPHLRQQLVVSIAAGLRLADLSRWLGGHRRLVRTMPNTPALIGAGVTGLYALPEVDAAGRAAAERVLQAVGSTLWIADEALMDSVTAVSGSGPAYVFLFIEALQQAALDLGFAPEQARQLAIETTLGAAKLAAQSAEPASVLRERVTSKGGTTAAALAKMDECGVLAGIVAGVIAADARGRELGELLGKD